MMECSDNIPIQRVLLQAGGGQSRGPLYPSYNQISARGMEEIMAAEPVGTTATAVATFKDGECQKKKTPLANGRVDPKIGGKALLKVRKDNSTESKNSENDKKDQSIIIRVGSVLFGGSIFLNLLLLFVTLTLISRLKRKRTKVQTLKVKPTMNLRSFTYSELEKATNGFKEELGCGAFGTVYKGELASEPTELVAVKKLDKMERDGEQEFQAEMTIFSARISDFGLAKLLKRDQTRTTTAIRGTRGYVAPEWFRNMPITVKVDVYSFGVLLLEIICCRKSCEQDVKEEDRIILVDWVYDCYMDGKLHLLVEKDEEAMKEKQKVKKFVMIAIWCIQEDPSLRPAMKKVIQMIEGAVEVPIPPNPTSFLSSI
ncbi:hypothetical protein CRYUN_Cryun03dG0110400 [Craigia yunnanensis]